jgi:serine protease Do
MKLWLPKSSHPRWLALTGAALLAGTALAVNPTGQGGSSTPNPKLSLQTDQTPLPRDASNSCAPVIKKLAPSVVRIAVTSQNSDRQMSDSDLDFFRRFFGGHGPMMPNGPGGPGAERERALGSGVIVSADGYIVTNNHVVQNARDIQVSLNDGRNFAAKVIGTDPQTDISLVKVDAQNLPFVTLADSDEVQVGDFVLAIGNPFGIGQTVTRGIVSAKDRATSVEQDEDFIQTDAAINPGNSGGALVDMQGRLVGINTAILSRTGGNQGIGFAVPSNLVRWVTEGLIKNGRVQRGLLGVSIQDLTPELAQALKVSRTNGALVADVSPNSPADTAGIKNGDVVLKFNNQPVENANQLKLRVAATIPGTTVPVQIDRNGETKDLNVTVQERSADKLAANNAPADRSQGDALKGVAVADLESENRTQLRIPGSVQGAVITDVDQSSPAYDAGLRPGDVITEINHHPVRNAQDAVNLTQKPSGSSTLVKVWSRGGTRYVAVNEGGSDS